jgi:MFS family permease
MLAQAEAQDPAAEAATPTYSRPYTGWVLGLLLAVYVSNFIDRTILSVLQQPIKEEFRLADWQLGLLGGLSFALLYSILGVPIARLAERRNRVSIITVALLVWSAMTALCGLASGYAQLLLCRVGVGVGEAGATPPAQSLISDYFPPERRATALSIYGLGVPIGSLLGSVVGGFIAQQWGWRAAFFAVGVPGLFLALLVRFTLREPPRGHSEGGGAVAEAPSTGTIVRVLWAKPAFRQLAAGMTVTSFAGYAMSAFAATYLMRAFHLNVAQAGLIAGLVNGLSAAAGTLLGGLLTDWAGRGDRRWYVWIPALGLVLSAPLYVAAYLQADLRVVLILLIVPGVLHYLYLGPTYAVMHNMVAPRMRATATALLLLVLNLIGLGFGPTLLGLASDIFAHSAFAGDFAVACPGGMPAKGATESASLACRAASATGLQWAMVVCSTIYVWAAAHYALAGRRLREDMIH